MDLESYRRWYDYSRARDMKLQTTARLNCISHILQLIPFNKVSRSEVKLPKRSNKHRFDDQISLKGMKFVPERY